MTIWIPFPCELERCYYDLELKSGQRLNRIWPLIRQGKPATFYSHNTTIVHEWLIARVRVHDETNKD